ncbi:hypothetical protein K438DRAFT_1983979 [Mycena galopus ATCC 62051]|nr:hypothetical protein K438DRAFT_1983979 [Mycena galopus ATCC 62051]
MHVMEERARRGGVVKHPRGRLTRPGRLAVRQCVRGRAFPVVSLSLSSQNTLPTRADLNASPHRNFVLDLPLSKLYSNDTQRVRSPRDHLGFALPALRLALGPAKGTHTETHTGRLVFEDMALVTTDGQTETPSLTTKFEEFDDLGGDEQVRELDVLELGGVRGEAESQITEMASSSGTGTGTMRRTDSETGQAPSWAFSGGVVWAHTARAPLLMVPPSQRPAPPSSTVLLLATHAQRSLALRSLTPLPAHLVRFAHPKLFLPPALTAQCLRLRLEPRRTAASSPYYAFHTCPLHVVRNPHAQPIPRYLPDTRTIRTLFAARFPPRYLLPGPQITAHSPHPSIVLDSF